MIPSALLALLLSLPVSYRAPQKIGMVPSACNAEGAGCLANIVYGDVSQIWQMCESSNLQPVLTANDEVICK